MIYLLHFDEPVCGKRHYIGYCDDSRLPERMIEHGKGRGAAFTRNMMVHHIEATVARIWPGGDRSFERRLKKSAHYERRCPLCNPEVDAIRPKEDIRVTPQLLPEATWRPLGW